MPSLTELVDNETNKIVIRNNSSEKNIPITPDQPNYGPSEEVDLFENSVSERDPTNNILANTTLKLYEGWIGNNTLCCQGRLILGPDGKLFIMTLILIFLPAIVYGPVIIPHFILFVHPAAGAILLILPLIGFIFMMIGLFYTSFTDPGIIPRRKYFDKHFANSIERPLNTRKTEPPPFQKVYLNNGEVADLKYCATCEIYRPPRASHCRRCDNCVERFDHHCPWTGTCIGRRNYRSFVLFIFSTTITSWFVILVCIAHTILVWIYYFGLNDVILDKVSNSIRYSIGGIIIMIYIFLSQLFVGSLSVFHSFLISSGQTTYEYVNKNKRNFNKGIFNNWFHTLCIVAECRRSKMMMRRKLPIPLQVSKENKN